MFVARRTCALGRPPLGPLAAGQTMCLSHSMSVSSCLPVMHSQNLRFKGTVVSKGSSQVDKRTTKKVKTKKGSILQQKDKKLAAIRDSSSDDKKIKKKAPSLLVAAGVKKRKELVDKKKGSVTKEARASRLTKPFKKKTNPENDVEVVGGDQEVFVSPEVSIPPREERDYLVPGDPGYEALPPPLTLEAVVQQLREEKAENIVALNIAEKCTFTKYMVIAEGRSGRHLRALGDRLVQQLKQRQRVAELNTEIQHMIDNNRDNTDWLTVDTGDVLVQLFSSGARRYYDLDELWITKGSLKEEMHKKIALEDLDPLPDLNDIPGGWNPFDMHPSKV